MTNSTIEQYPESSQNNLARDRIAQVYLGLTGDPQFQDRSKRRINWIASQAIGEQIIDIGCSEGILSIILAREAFKVIGVDVNNDALNFGRNLLAKENEFVQKRVTFIHSDLMNADLEPESFDTVILGEVIEHLVKPEYMLKKAFDYLKPGGKTIITTPFGYHPDPDHCQTFTLSCFVELLKSHCNPNQLYVEDNYIRFVGFKEEPDSQKWAQFDNTKLLSITEKAAISQQYFLRDRLTEKSKQLYNISSKYREAQKTTTSIEEKLKSLNEKYVITSNQLNELKTKKNSHQREIQQLIEQYQGSQEALHANEKKLVDLIEKLKNVEAEKKKINQALDQAETERNLLQEELAENKKILKSQQHTSEKMHKLAAEKIEARERAAANYVLTKKRLEELRHSISYNFFQAITLAFTKPGKNTLILPYRLIELISKGFLRLFRRVKSQAMLTLPLVLPDGLKTSIDFITNKPNNIAFDGNILRYFFRTGEAGYISSKENCNFSLTPQTNMFNLESGTTYVIDLPFKIISGSIVLYCIEFDQHKRVGEHIFRNLGSERLTFSFTTHDRHQFLCLAFRLNGFGSIAINQGDVKITKSNLMPSNYKNRSNPLFSIACDSGKKANSMIPVLTILDEISELCWSNEFDIRRISRSNFVEQIAGSISHFALLESCWKGNDALWEYAFTSPGLKHVNARDLLRAIDTLKARKMPIVFWNKEDPMHFERYLPIARHANVIATTDSMMVEKYRKLVPDAFVGVLPFAAQQKVCNPVDRFRHDSENICFAGSYYCYEHDDRKCQMDALLPSIKEFDGAIYDRMFHLKNDRYKYPEIYTPFIRPGVPFREMVKLYKRFRVFLNVNTITESPTMMSRRVYELLASGTVVVSTPSKAIDNQFPGIVQIAATASDAKQTISKLLEDEWYWSRISHLGYRQVLQKHTYTHRRVELLQMLGQTEEFQVPLVSMIVPTIRPEMIDRITENLTGQNHPKLEAIIITHDYSSASLEKLKTTLKSKAKENLVRVEILELNGEQTLGERLNAGIKLARGDYIAKMDDDDFYFENYISDILLPFSFGNYDVVGKKEIFVYLESEDAIYLRYPGCRHQNTEFVTGATMVMKKSLFEKISFLSMNRSEDSTFLDQVNKMGGRIYSADPFNFVVFRSKEPGCHTWQIKDTFFKNKGHLYCDKFDISKVSL